MPLSNQQLAAVAKTAEATTLADKDVFNYAAEKAAIYEPTTFALYMTQYAQGDITAQECADGLKQMVVRIARLQAVDNIYKN